ncbi:hypothetical protein BGZ76_009164 [Entomortierella beljakovae]|nr:hypothetical protein BGZ76_009164 [Entomortierella beljakovae]
MDYYTTVQGKKFKRFAYGSMPPFQRSEYKFNFKDPCSMSFVPVAFMLTHTRKSTSLTRWLNHIKDTIGTPELITTDDA